MIQKKELIVIVEGKGVVLEFGKKKAKIDLGKQPFLLGISKLVRDPKEIKSIQVAMDKKASFSTTRQITTVLNVLAWQLKIKINNKKQIKAEYSALPSITTPNIRTR